MISLNNIKEPIEWELKEFEREFKKSMQSSVPLLDKIANYIIKSKGKQIRPLLVFLSAKVSGGITKSTYTAATLIELLHTATLVHDDIVDNSYERRGFFSINALWKNKIAVLIGDYLFAKGLLTSLKSDEFQLLKIVSIAVEKMSEGELLQIEKSRKLDITEDIYFDIIKRKTASLLVSCCQCGAISANASIDDVNKMVEFGENLGIAFQIKDDLFDYGNSKKIGKPTGIDIKEKKMTLPLIYSLNNCSKTEKNKIIKTFKNKNINSEDVINVVKFVEEKGGMEYSNKIMQEYKNKALKSLESFPESESKNSLKMLVEYTIEREK